MTARHVLTAWVGLATVVGCGGSGTDPEPAPALVSITVEPDTVTITESEELGPEAVGTYDDGSSRDLSTSVTWSSDEAGIARVEPDEELAWRHGVKIVGVSVGKTTVRARLGALEGTLEVAVVSAAFDFMEEDAATLARVDRVGAPFAAPLFVTDETAFAAGDPDGDGAFASDVASRLAALHAGLDDDLDLLGYTPCASATCTDSLTLVTLPSVLHVDATAAAGFPNGRRLEDPVLDLLLARALLDLSVHAPEAFATRPLNPKANDVPFLAAFPFLAGPHAIIP